MKALVTGALGFVGKNLIVTLRERSDIEIITHLRSDSLSTLHEKLKGVDFIFHLAGVNRTENEALYSKGNEEITIALCEAIKSEQNNIPLIYTSSTQATSDNAYGRSKLAAERALRALNKATGNLVYIYRLPNVFGKWCQPDYNSVVATFCNNISQGLPIEIHNPSSILRLVYIDDVVGEFVRIMDELPLSGVEQLVKPEYETTVGELARQITTFRDRRETGHIERVGAGFTRALYATLVSYLKPEQFAYMLTSHIDHRGKFFEFLKTQDSGQLSFFTAHPGITRGGHYHHTKLERFIVVKGNARFRFRHIETDEICELYASGDEPQVVETVPGWSHDITNVGEEELMVVLWANEVFNPDQPDTVAHKV